MIESIKSIDSLIILLIVHFLLDFQFQPDTWIDRKRNKDKFPTLTLFHSFLHGLFSYLLLLNWQGWLVGLLIMIIHFIIDVIKSRSKDTLRSFVIDQILHIISIVVVWFVLIKLHDRNNTLCLEYFFDTNTITFILFIILLTRPASVYIRISTRNWITEEIEKDGLKNAGRYIGYLERLLVFTFMLIQEYQVIGFILAAKSIFRFGEIQKKSERMKTEYFLIGTLLSFAIAAFAGLIYNYIS